MIAGLGGDTAATGQLLTILSGYLRGYFGRRLGSGAADLEDLVHGRDAAGDPSKARRL